MSQNHRSPVLIKLHVGMSGKAEEEANSPHEERIVKHIFLAAQQHFLKMHSTKNICIITTLHRGLKGAWAGALHCI